MTGDKNGPGPRQADVGATAGPLSGLRVIDAGVLFAGPVIGTLLADFGADVIKVEHPRGDSLRTLGWQKNGVSLWWAFVSRNKRFVSINLSTSEGAALLKELVATADVLIESFRPGTFERWGLGPDVLHAINPRLVMVRTSGFGQTGPYSPRPGFGTVAESISGYAHINGQPDGPPTLPPFALGDGIASLFGTFATMFALYHRDTHAAPGQVIDLAIYEPLFWILGPQALVYDQLGIIAGRTGSRTEWTAPRNAYRQVTADGSDCRRARSRSPNA
jgi:formyl-CoA transferase